jgi:hypothetical protein
MEFYIPSPEKDLQRITDLLKAGEAFCFIRFSDGEVEVLRNRYLEIDSGVTVFRGRTFGNKFPEYDSKRFDPERHAQIRRDLLASAMMRAPNYFKGLPSKHNRAIIDREFLVRLNGGMCEFITFSDLLMNSNYPKFRRDIVPLFGKIENLAVMANYRAKLGGELAHAQHLPVEDNFFENYDEVMTGIFDRVSSLPEKTVVLSSASSLSNIIGMKLYRSRPDISFIDVGSAINDLLGLDSTTRAYHDVYVHSEGPRARRYSRSVEYRIKW